MNSEQGKYKVVKVKTLKSGSFEGSAVVYLEPIDDAVGKITLITDSIELMGVKKGNIYSFQEVPQ